MTAPERPETDPDMDEPDGEAQESVATPRIATIGEILEARHHEFVARIRERERRTE